MKCVGNYSHEGRAKYWFTFTFEKYPDLFDVKYIKTMGFWDPKTNPGGLCRDHRVSVNESIKNNYDPFYIKHPLNCEFMCQSDNSKKNVKSSITYNKLVLMVDEYESKIGKLPGI